MKPFPILSNLTGMVFRNLTIALFLVLGLPNLLLAQKFNQFDEDQQVFISQFENLIRNQLKDHEKPLLKELTDFWNNDSISLSISQRERVIEVSNALLKKTSHDVSHFIGLAKIMVSYPHDDILKQSFNSWVDGLDLLAQDNKTSISKIARFINNSFLLYTNKVIASNPAFSWKASKNRFTLHTSGDFYFEFTDIDLICINDKGDSIAIEQTSGRLFPFEDKWFGKDGKVTWVRSNFPVDEIFAQLSTYSIDLTKNEYEADSVLFTNLDYFQEPSLGKLKDKVSRASRPEQVVYPEFHTYTQRHKIKNFFEDVDYDGGYYMAGSQFIGRGTQTDPAIIEIKRNNQDFLRVEALSYIFRRQTLISNYAQVRFKLDADSLYHNGLMFSYNDNDRLVAISPTDFLTTQSPMLSSYHNFSFRFGQIQWQLDSDEITLGAPIGSSLGRAFFESNNYFSEEEFDMLMGRDDQHPLLALANYTKRIQSRIFLVNEFAMYIRKSVEQTRIEVMRLAMLGYILYEAETGTIQTLPKLYDAIRARGRYIDYDVLKFSSTSEGIPNARLNLNTFEMDLVGVSNVSVSDSQNVFIYPSQNKLSLKKDRNFAFDGVVQAGLFTFYGKDFNFDYANFSLNLNSIDSLNIDYQTKDYDFYGRRVLQKVTSTLENITGEILIDSPNNKSGLKFYKEFPIFKSTKHSFVYYDDKSIHNGVYKRDNFFFEIYPFTFTNINQFEIEDMNFIGMFYSADIIGPVEDTLILRPDNSLGFRRTSPPEGYAVYEGRGRLFNNIDLSNQGLQGIGDLHYITTTVTSDNIYLFPDSMRTVTSAINMKQQMAGIQFPQLEGGEHLVKWYPFKEELYAKKGKKPFSVFNKQAMLTGDIVLKPLGLVGEGFMDLNKARLQSKHYAFNALDFQSDTANIEFDAVSTNELAFTANKMKAWVDFDSRQGLFNKIDNSLLANLPPMMYRSYLDELTWKMDENELTISSPEQQPAIGLEEFYVSRMVDRDTIPAGALFYSYHNQEDSLYFVSPVAHYNLYSPSIKADSVGYIIVADAIIHPKDKRIQVDAKNRLLPLTSSVITANYTDRYHTIYDAKITVPSRKSYYASGTIDYIDENDSIQPLFLRDIKIDDQGHTFADGAIAQTDSFKLSPRFGYTGNFEVSATEKHWMFTGGAQPIYSCPQMKSSNISFKERLNPTNLFIPVDQTPRNLNMVHLISGSIITVDSIHLYPGLLTSRKEYSDKSLVSSNGYIHFNKQRNRFLMGSKEKINNADTTGNLISLAVDYCTLFSEGTVNIPVNLGQIKHFSTGSLSHNLKDSILNMDMILALNFHFNPLSLQAMANEILETEGLLRVDLNRKLYEKYLYTRLSPAEAQKGVNQIKLFGALTQVPEEIASTITFTDLQLQWNQANRSFVSKGKLGIGTIGNTQVNRKVDGFVEIYKRNTGDWMILYVQLSSEKYYVFYYARGSMQVSSHNALFNDPINSMRTRERRVKVKAGEIPFNFVIGTRRELERARDRYKEILTGTSATPMSDEHEDEENDEAYINADAWLEDEE